MIKYFEYNKNINNNEVYSFIYNVMKEEINTYAEELDKITADLKNINSNYKNGGNFWIAIDDETNDIIGSVAIKKVNDFYQFCRFYVKKEYRNNHVGLNLYLLAESYIIDNKIKDIYLISGDELKNAHKFYKQNGWKKSNDKTPFYIRTNASLYKKHYHYYI